MDVGALGDFSCIQDLSINYNVHGGRIGGCCAADSKST